MGEEDHYPVSLSSEKQGCRLWFQLTGIYFGGEAVSVGAFAIPLLWNTSSCMEARLSSLMQKVCVKGRFCNFRAVCFLLLLIPLFLTLPLCLSKPFHSFLQAEVIHLWKNSSFQRTFNGCQNSRETAVLPFQTAPTSSPVSQVEKSSCHSRNNFFLLSIS